MSHDTGLFHAPDSYPAPPKGMYYSVPQDTPRPQEKPKAIFPWEQENSQRPKPSRVFADEEPTIQQPPPTSQPTDSPLGQQQPRNLLPSAPIKDPWSSFTLTNAWDNNSSIQDYVRAVKHAQTTRGQVQVLKHDTDSSTPIATSTATVSSTGAEEATSAPMLNPPVLQANPSRFSPKRRESLILTDFPTEFERPSLPVTPAPIRRPTFWGIERDESGELPPAEGVPNQNEWDPHAQLEMLRKSSFVRADDMPDPAAIEELLNKKTAPQRDLPESSQSFLTRLARGDEPIPADSARIGESTVSDDTAS